jgi:CRISPR-associated protein Csm4
LPKPIVKYNSLTGNKNDQEKTQVKTQEDEDRKKIKKIEFLPIDKINLMPDKWGEIDNNFGKEEVVAKVYKRNGEIEVEPYNVGTFQFNNDCGLYIIAQFSSENSVNLFEEVLDNLQYSGIGGKRSAGYGKFKYERHDIPKEINELLVDNKTNIETSPQNQLMTLSCCFPKEEELESVAKDATYLLEKNSGFVYSFDYYDSLLRKKDFYKFTSGSVFTNKFDGDIFDVSDSSKGKHKVYSYAKSMFLKLNIER